MRSRRRSGTSRRRIARRGQIVKIILYGSFARGGWVADRAGRYFSDYDLLVLVNHSELADPEYWYDASDRLARLRSLHSVNFEVFDWAEANDRIAKGQPFFVDIRRDGIIVYESAPAELTRPGNLSPEEKRAEAQAHFEEWFPASLSFLKVARYCIAEKEWKLAAFNLHQACETAYHGLLLAYTLYSPKSHNLKHLRGRAEALEPRLMPAWPRAGQSERRVFERIKRAYVGARYSRYYRIEDAELAFAEERVAMLQEIVKTVCKERLGL